MALPNLPRLSNVQTVPTNGTNHISSAIANRSRNGGSILVDLPSTGSEFNSHFGNPDSVVDVSHVKDTYVSPFSDPDSVVDVPPTIEDIYSAISTPSFSNESSSLDNMLDSMYGERYEGDNFFRTPGKFLGSATTVYAQALTNLSKSKLARIYGLENTPGIEILVVDRRDADLINGILSNTEGEFKFGYFELNADDGVFIIQGTNPGGNDQETFLNYFQESSYFKDSDTPGITIAIDFFNANFIPQVAIQPRPREDVFGLRSVYVGGVLEERISDLKTRQKEELARLSLQCKDVNPNMFPDSYRAFGENQSNLPRKIVEGEVIIFSDPSKLAKVYGIHTVDGSPLTILSFKESELELLQKILANSSLDENDYEVLTVEGNAVALINNEKLAGGNITLSKTLSGSSYADTRAELNLKFFNPNFVKYHLENPGIRVVGRNDSGSKFKVYVDQAYSSLDEIFDKINTPDLIPRNNQSGKESYSPLIFDCKGPGDYGTLECLRASMLGPVKRVRLEREYEGLKSRGGRVAAIRFNTNDKGLVEKIMSGAAASLDAYKLYDVGEDVVVLMSGPKLNPQTIIDGLAYSGVEKVLHLKTYNFNSSARGHNKRKFAAPRNDSIASVALYLGNKSQK